VLKLRRNEEMYVKFIDFFGPCVVQKRPWKMLQMTLPYRMTHDVFQKTFSTSDEAFLLVVLCSYADKWKMEVQKVSCVYLNEIVCNFWVH